MKTRLKLTCGSCDSTCTVTFTASVRVEEMELYCPFCGELIDHEWPESGEEERTRDD